MRVVTDDKHYHDIGEAIREKNGTETQYKPSEMADAVRNIPSGGGVDYSALESVLSDGYTDYSYYFYDKELITEAPSEILQHTASGTHFAYMFYNNKALTAFPPIDISNGIDFNRFLYGCSALTEVPVLDTQKCDNAGYFFSYCSKLVTIGGIDISKARTISSMFVGCDALENITFNGVIKKSGLSLSSCTKLTHESLMSIINALYDWAAEGSTSTYTLTLGSTNLAKLTDAEKAIATQKGWTLA